MTTDGNSFPPVLLGGLLCEGVVVSPTGCGEVEGNRGEGGGGTGARFLVFGNS